MKYAIISDVHGNKPAFDAVIRDAKDRGINNFIIAGDYCLSGPYPNECVEAMRSMEDAVIIRGNEEHYFEDLIGADQSKWTDGQMQISYWNYRNIKSENLKWLLALPYRSDISCNTVQIHTGHKLDDHIKADPVFAFNSSPHFAQRYADRDITAGTLKQHIENETDNDEFRKCTSALYDGVYIFGHTHVQWSYKLPGREVYLINPGSCGLPLDCIRNSIPYTVLSIDEDGRTQIEECRVPFDMKEYTEMLKTTSQYSEATVWSKVIIRELLTAREHMMFFLKFADEYANSIGDHERPICVDTWEKAYEAWVKSLE